MVGSEATGIAWAVREGFSEEVTFKQRPAGLDKASHAKTRGGILSIHSSPCKAHWRLPGHKGHRAKAQGRGYRTRSAKAGGLEEVYVSC